MNQNHHFYISYYKPDIERNKSVMRPYHMSGNSNRSCDRSSVSPSAHRAGSAFCADSTPCADSASCPGNIRTGSDYVLAMAYVPWQQFSTVYEPDRALSAGTIFPELDKPFLVAKGGRCR